jgi:hypothetical protein
MTSTPPRLHHRAHSIECSGEWDTACAHVCRHDMYAVMIGVGSALAVLAL